MNALTKAPHHPQLITDIVSSDDHLAMNRRGHAMRAMTATSVPEPVTHYCYQHHYVPRELSQRKPLSLAQASWLPDALYALKAVLPAWAPRKFTLQGGVQTNWVAVLPSAQTLKSSGILAVFLIASMLAVWALPHNNTPPVIAEQPPVVTDRSPASHAPQGTLAANTTSSAVIPAGEPGLTSGRASNVTTDPIPALSAQPQSTTPGTASSPAGTAPPATPSSDTSPPPPASGDGTSTPPADPDPTPVDPPIDPPAEPEVPAPAPPVIVDPMLESVNELFALNEQ